MLVTCIYGWGGGILTTKDQGRRRSLDFLGYFLLRPASAKGVITFNLNFMKSFLKILLFSIVFSANYFSPNTAKADCTMTNRLGTDGRCFTQNGEYVCLARAEDQHCFTTTIAPGVGG